MQIQRIGFAVQKENGIVTRIGKSTIYQPKAGFKSGGNSIELYQDRPKMDIQSKNQKG